LGESAEGQRSPGRLDIIEGGSLKGTEARGPYVLQDEPAGKMTGLAEKAALAGSQEIKESLPPMEQVTQEECRGLVRSCREERQKRSCNSGWPLIKGQKIFLQVHQQKKEGQGESPTLIRCEGEYCQQG